MRVLGIESSCDETAIALVEGKGERVRPIWSIIRSQADLHSQYGGVVPEVAAREHVEILAALVREHLSRDGAGIDAVAVTYGPGLAPALRVGVETAKALAWGWKKPLIPVNHLAGHIYAAWFGEDEGPKWPFLALLVSGGHTELILVRGHGEFFKLGETRDDAVGECFDKVAKMVGLGYPGGPRVEARAESGNVEAWDWPRPMIKEDNYDFSFSGLKTAVLYSLKGREKEFDTPGFIEDVCASFQAAAVEVLVEKTVKCALAQGVKTVVLAGGVAANLVLRAELTRRCEEAGIEVKLPPFQYSLDNAGMIAAAGYFLAKQNAVTGEALLAVKVDPKADLHDHNNNQQDHKTDLPDYAKN